MTHRLFHQIGPRKYGANFNTLDEILTCQDEMSFDGIYESVFNAHARGMLRPIIGRVTHLFICGSHLGKDNAFDRPVERGEPGISRFCTLDQVKRLADYLQCKIGYHGWAHLRCHTLTEEEIRRELELPSFLAGLGIDAFAWPHGDYDERCIRIAREMGYKEAWSVKQGDGSQFAKKREHLGWS